MHQGELTFGRSFLYRDVSRPIAIWRAGSFEWFSELRTSGHEIRRTFARQGQVPIPPISRVFAERGFSGVGFGAEQIHHV
jgi:hypothetical protein